MKTPKYIEVPVCSSVPRYVCTPIIKQVPDTICVDETYEKCAKVPNQVRIGQAALQISPLIVNLRLWWMSLLRPAVMFLRRCVKM